MESLAQLEHVPDVRNALADGQHRAVDAIAEIVADADGHDSATAVSAFYYVLLNGLIVTWLVESYTAPDGDQIAEAITSLAAPANRKRRT